MTKGEIIRQTFSALLTTVLVCAIGYGTYKGYMYMSERAKPPAVDRNAVAMPVDVDVVGRRDLQHKINLFATVSSDETVDIKPKISGRLERLSLDDGTSTTIGTVVKKGEVIALLDRREFEAKVEYAQGVFETAQAAIPVAKSAVDVAKVNLVDAERELQRQEELQERSAGMKQLLDKALTERDRCLVLVQQSEASLQQAEASLKQAEASLKQAKIDLDETLIRAPFDGIVTDKYVGHGTLMTPTTALVSIANHYIVKVKMAVPQEFLRYIYKDSTRVSLTSNLWDFPFNDTVYRIYPTLDPVTRTSIVELRTKNFILSDGNWAFRPEMYLDGSILIGTLSNVVALPMDILVRLMDEYIVFIVEDGKVRAQKVKIGIRDGAMVEITEGLQGGETIVVNGQFRLTDGVLVNVRNDGAQK